MRFNMNMKLHFVARRDQEHLDTKEMGDYIVGELLKVFPDDVAPMYEEMYAEIVRIVEESPIFPPGAKVGMSLSDPDGFGIDLTECIFHI